MTVNDRKIYSSADKTELIRRGFAEERLYNLTFRYEYTEAEKEKNAADSRRYDLGSAEWNAHICHEAQRRSGQMFPIMCAIADALPCYQFSAEENCGYDTDQWDLFFWCNHFQNVGYLGLDGWDYSYFTLGFNKLHSQHRREEILKKVLDVLKRFEDDEHLSVTVQYTVEVDETMTHQEAKRVAPLLVGKRTEYVLTNELFNISCPPMDGRIVENGGRLLFMKKRSRTRGYLLSDIDILNLFWKMERTGEIKA